MSAAAVELDAVFFRADDRALLEDITWSIRPDERWIVLGPNGSGKTTLLKVLSAQIHPASGRADILGSRLGRVDVRQLRRRIGVVSGSVIRSLRRDITVEEVVLSGRKSALETWWDEYGEDDHMRATASMRDNNVLHLAGSTFDVISEGERQRVLIARALASDPELLLLDEPFAGLDLGARELLLQRLDHLFSDSRIPPSVLVTHHAEEIPGSATHALLLRAGRVVAAGPLGSTLSSQNVSTAFDLDISMSRTDLGRWSARVR